jgi:hypothetical protein
MGSIDAREVIPPVFTGQFDSNSIILRKSSSKVQIFALYQIPKLKTSKRNSEYLWRGGLIL